MPNILTYDAPLDRVTPTDRAADTAREAGAVENRFGREAGEAIGRGIGAFGRPIQEMVNEAENHDVLQLTSHGMSVSSQLNANLTQNAADTFSKGDVTDSSIAPGLREQANKSIDNFLEQYTGENVPKKVQDWALDTANQMRSHQGNLITSFEMERSAGAIKANLQTRLVADANTVDLDPASLPGVLAKRALDNKTLLDSLHVLPEQRNVLEETAKKGDSVLAYTAAQSIGKNNPDGLRKQLADGTYSKWLTPEQTGQLKRYADEQQHAIEHDAKVKQQEDKQAAIEKSQEKADGYQLKMFDPNTQRILRNSPNTVQQITNDPDLTRHDKAFLINWNRTNFEAQRRADKEGAEPQGDMKSLEDAKRRVGDQTNPLTREEVNDGLAAEKWNRKQAGDLMWRIGQKDAEWNAIQRQFKPQMDVVARAIKSEIGANIDPIETATRVNQMEQDAQQKLRALYNAHDKAGLQAALDPKSPQYVFANNTQRAPGPALKAGADQVRGKGPEVSGRIVKTRDQVQAGEQYTAPDGSIRTKR